jgi:hypothetical protein
MMILTVCDLGEKMILTVCDLGDMWNVYGGILLLLLVIRRKNV